MRVFQKPEIFTTAVIKRIEKGILVNFFGDLFVSSFTTSSTRFSKFGIHNLIFFQIKVFGRNITDTSLARYFIKVTARPSFIQLRVIRRINRVD